jgi:predicted secreted hydrolase
MPATNSKLGKAFSAWLDTVANFYDADILATIKAAAAASPSPATVEVGLQLLNAWSGTGLKVPTANPTFSFPADHGEHWDMPIEWRYLTLSLNLKGGGRVSAICNIFRKAIATAATAPDLTTLERQIYSTSIAVTVELPGQAVVHYSLPVRTFSSLEDAITVANDPFQMVMGDQVSLTGTSEVFPIAFKIADPGDDSRPALLIDVKAAATNPLFLQGDKGYIGAPNGGVFWYYYSWPQQATTGSVTIAGTAYTVESGLTWMDHQWGGTTAPAAATPPAWTGWCWFEFQFDGDRSLTLAAPHQAVADGKLPFFNPGFGVYVDNGVSTLIPALLEVWAYTPSAATGVAYPSAWTIEAGTLDGPVLLGVTPKTVLADQAMWMGGLTEYSEAAATVTAIGVAHGKPVKMSGVGYCEGVGFENPAERNQRDLAWLRAHLES